MPVWVTNGNAPVGGLTAADFQLLDNGVPQPFTIATGDPPPMDVIVVLDVSGSVAGKALDQLKVDVQRLNEQLHATDRLRLVTFARDVADVFGLQPGGAPVPVDRITSGGMTSFYNALAAALMMSAADRPQLVFAFTDGRDDASVLDAGQIVSLAERSNAALYLAIVPGNDRIAVSGTVREQLANEYSLLRSIGPYLGGPNISALRTAAARTGGALYENPSNTQLPAIFKRVLDDFRSSYVLMFAPTSVARPGWHDLTVRVTNTKFSVRARKGYDGG